MQTYPEAMYIEFPPGIFNCIIVIVSLLTLLPFLCTSPNYILQKQYPLSLELFSSKDLNLTVIDRENDKIHGTRTPAILSM